MRNGIRRLHHVGISVPDLDRAKAFYCELLGMTVLNSRPWSEGDARMDGILGLQGSSGERALLQGLNTHIELWWFRSPSQVAADHQRQVSHHGITHLCFEVDDLQAHFNAMSGAGVRFLSGPARGPTGSLAVYAQDPFGNFLEFFQPSESA